MIRQITLQPNGQWYFALKHFALENTPGMRTGSIARPLETMQELRRAALVFRASPIPELAPAVSLHGLAIGSQPVAHRVACARCSLGKTPSAVGPTFSR